MDNWKPNDRAATTTWLTLRTLAQIPKDLIFKEAGSLTMNQLAFWAKSSSLKMRRVQAESLSIMIDNVFRDVRGAKYEEGVTNQMAVDSIRDALLDKDKTVADLAEVNDQSYLFWGEGQNV